MKWLTRWLAEEAKGKKFWLQIFWGTLIFLFYHFIVGNIIYYSGLLEAKVPVFNEAASEEDWKRLPSPTLFYSPIGFLLMFLLFIFEEELFYRFPLAFFVWLKWPLKRMLLVAATLSLLFGFFHGGILYVFLQGTIGFGLCLIFLKCGGSHKRYFKAIGATTLTHCFLNGVLLAISVLQGYSPFYK